MTELFGDAWWFDRSGGDVVLAGAGFDQPCVPHNDWQGIRIGMISLSIFVDEVTPELAPLILWSRSTGRRFVGVGQRGAVLLRDVDTIHSGSENRGIVTRALPAYRFVTSEGIRNGFTRAPFVPEHVFAKFLADLQQRCVFIRKAQAPAIMPPNLDASKSDVGMRTPGPDDQNSEDQ